MTKTMGDAKIGDTVQFKEGVGKYQVIGIHETRVWIKRIDSFDMYGSAFSAQLKEFKGI